MSLILIFIGIVMLPGIIGAAMKIGELFFSAVAFALGGLLFIAVLSFGTCSVIEAAAGTSQTSHHGR